MCLVQPSQFILSPHSAVSRLGIGCKTSLRAQVSELRPASAGGAQPALGVLSFPKRRVIDSPPVPPGVFVSLSPPAHSRHRCGFDAYRDTVRHATPDDLAVLAGLLARLRAIEGLVERRPGVLPAAPGLLALPPRPEGHVCARPPRRRLCASAGRHTGPAGGSRGPGARGGGGAGHALSATNCA